MSTNNILAAIKSGDVVVTEDGKAAANGLDWTGWRLEQALDAGYIEQTAVAQEREVAQRQELGKLLEAEEAEK
jgi:hypothetical protein